MDNLSENGAGYRESGTDNLRGNETILNTPIISDKGMVKNVVGAAYQKSGTENIRGNERDLHVPIITGTANGAPRFTPATVKSFSGNTP